MLRLQALRDTVQRQRVNRMDKLLRHSLTIIKALPPDAHEARIGNQYLSGQAGKQ